MYSVAQSKAFIGSLAFGALTLVATASTAEAKLKVVTTTSDLADIARAVAGDLADVNALTSGTQDAHFVDAKPSTMIKARSADLFIEVGMELEIGWAGAVVEGSRNAKLAIGQPGRLDASAGILRLEVPSGAVDRSMGDVHALGNPHYWLDPWNARVVADNVAARLAQIDAANAAAYRAHAADFQRRVDEAMFGKPLTDALGAAALWKLELAPGFPASLEAQRHGNPALPPLGGWAGKMAPFAGQRVFTYHRSWSYLIGRFGLRSAGEIEPKPGIPPTPGHLVELVSAARTEPVRAILVEPFYNDQAAKLVAGQINATVLRLPLSVGGDAASTDWFALMSHLVDSVSAALAGKV